MTAPARASTSMSMPDTSTLHLRWMIREAESEARGCRGTGQEEAAELYTALAAVLAAVVAERDEARATVERVRVFLTELEKARKETVNDHDEDTTAYLDTADMVIAQLTAALAGLPPSSASTAEETTP